MFIFRAKIVMASLKRRCMPTLCHLLHIVSDKAHFPHRQSENCMGRCLSTLPVRQTRSSPFRHAANNSRRLHLELSFYHDSFIALTPRLRSIPSSCTLCLVSRSRATVRSSSLKSSSLNSSKPGSRACCISLISLPRRTSSSCMLIFLSRSRLIASHASSKSSSSRFLHCYDTLTLLRHRSPP